MAGYRHSPDWVHWNTYYDGRVALYYNREESEWLVVDDDFREQTWRFNSEASAHDFIIRHISGAKSDRSVIIPERPRVVSVRDKVQSRYKEQK